MFKLEIMTNKDGFLSTVANMVKAEVESDELRAFLELNSNWEVSGKPLEALKENYPDLVYEVSRNAGQTDTLSPEILDDLKIARMYVGKAYGAAKRGISFELTWAQYKRLQSLKRCYYTGVKFDPTDPDKVRTLDRVDSSKGYTHENTVVCTNHINKLKNALLECSDFSTHTTLAELYSFVDKLKQIGYIQRNRVTEGD